MTPTPVTQPGPPHRPAWALAGLAAVATGIAGYLAWVAWQQHGLPVGCGENGGCAEVLTSRWSSLVGIPVGALAIPLYLLVGALALRPQGPLARTGLAFAAASLVAAAAWFLFLQAAVLGAFCPWCVGEHLLGLTMAALATGQLRALGTGSDIRRLLGGGLLGVLSVAGLALVQTLQPAASTTLRLADAESATPTGSTDGDTLLQGRLNVVPAEEPCLGDPAAPHRLYLMFDYCCPHCRRTHEYLLEALALYPDRFSVVCLPMPRDADCNPAIAETETRFEAACELAELALAVWSAKPEAFAEFDRWLFAASPPPSPQAARARAEQLVSAERLADALQRDDLRRRIARNVQAFNDSQLDYLPVMMSPGMDTIVGRPEDREALLKILKEDLLRISSE
jgi:uncharacterized membrane protein